MSTEPATPPSTQDKAPAAPSTPDPFGWIDADTLAHIRALVATWPQPGMTQLRAVASLRPPRRA